MGVRHLLEEVALNHISDWVTHISNPGEAQYLRSKLPDVCMRLFRVNDDYRKLVLACCSHISKVCMAKLEGYKTPHGTSGANCAIPFNIICINKFRDTDQAMGWVMINPKIEVAIGLAVADSNCGSIRLDAPIRVKRFKTVDVSWYDVNGEWQRDTFGQSNYGFTIQHEIDHNNGVLITDRKVE